MLHVLMLTSVRLLAKIVLMLQFVRTSTLQLISVAARCSFEDSNVLCGCKQLDRTLEKDKSMSAPAGRVEVVDGGAARLTVRELLRAVPARHQPLWLWRLPEVAQLALLQAENRLLRHRTCRQLVSAEHDWIDAHWSSHMLLFPQMPGRSRCTGPDRNTIDNLPMTN